MCITLCYGWKKATFGEGSFGESPFGEYMWCRMAAISKSLKTAKRAFGPGFGYVQDPKAGRNTQQTALF